MIIDDLIAEGVITKECREAPFLREAMPSYRKKKRPNRRALTKEDTEQISYLYKSTYVTQKELANTYGVSIPTIQNAIRSEYNV